MAGGDGIGHLPVSWHRSGPHRGGEVEVAAEMSRFQKAFRRSCQGQCHVIEVIHVFVPAQRK